MLYNGFVRDLVRRFQDKFTSIKIEHNFEYGPEFEIAICEVLRELLPGRAGICRGYVVGRTGEPKGDDIIIYDAGRFPTLRSLGRDLAKREQVPAEAVLAYIEAKHTLYVDDVEDAKRQNRYGQHLAKALQQVAAVTSIPRDQVPLARVGRLTLPGSPSRIAPGYPAIWNPWYSMIFARHLAPQNVDPPEELAKKCLELARHVAILKGSVARLPDLIVAGDVIALPVIAQRNEDGQIPMGTDVELRPFLCSTTELFFFGCPELAMGAAVLHMLWAMEEIDLRGLRHG
jgi:hypothetical protein